MTMPKLNTRLLTKVATVNFLVQHSPAIIAAFMGILIKSKLTEKALGVGAAVLAGMLLKDQDYFSIALAIGGTDLAADYIMPMVSGMLPAAPPVTQVPIKPGDARDTDSLSEYLRLSEYISAPAVTNNHANIYTN